MLVTKQDGTAISRTVSEKTNARSTSTYHGCYMTGLFLIEDGSERWQVGCDDESTTEAALHDLEKGNEFVVEDRSELSMEALFDTMRNANAASTMLDACRDLTDVERETIESAADAGYFESPREATLSTLADEFDVSTAAVSKNMRRGEKKLLRSVVAALDDLD